jgi:hypothetical protein
MRELRRSTSTIYAIREHEAATEGATLRELMDRMSHTSPRAAMIYQHAAGP